MRLTAARVLDNDHDHIGCPTKGRGRKNNDCDLRLGRAGAARHAEVLVTAILSDRPVNGLNPAIWNFRFMKFSRWQAGPAMCTKLRPKSW